MEHMKEIESNLAYSHVITSEHIQARVKSEVTDHPIPNSYLVTPLSCLLVYDTYNTQGHVDKCNTVNTI